MLEFKNVCVSVGKTPILQNINVKFESEKITSIIGPNGCGKTTLLQTLNGISTVTDGDILIDDENYIKLPIRERAKRLSFMSQYRESAPNIPVKVLVEHGRFPYMGFSRKMNDEDIEHVENAMKYTDVCAVRNQKVSELSGGLQQRTYLAMQLAQNSRYMVMDEPMNHLDFPGQREMYSLVESLGKNGKTVILVLHDLNRALQISDYLVVMKDRKIIGTGTPEECLESGMISNVFSCDIKKVEINGVCQYVII